MNNNNNNNNTIRFSESIEHPSPGQAGVRVVLYAQFTIYVSTQKEQAHLDRVLSKEIGDEKK